MQLASEAVRVAAQSPFLENAVGRARAVLCCLYLPPVVQRAAGQLGISCGLSPCSHMSLYPGLCCQGKLACAVHVVRRAIIINSCVTTCRGGKWEQQRYRGARCAHGGAGGGWSAVAGVPVR